MKLCQIHIRIRCRGQQDKWALPKKANKAVVEVHETKVRRGEPRIKNVNNELVACSCPHAVEYRV
jgi:hypothetical protein